ncbi:MAG: class I SAM-dependent methyltransferase [Chloroflexi bacterium]|nr:class I SAM-dependent methyltransferase [Chloroflexota bacterium]
MMSLLAVFFLLLVLGFLFWWLIVETEGVYIGRRVVILLYDLYASRYDRVKQFDDHADLMLISQPIMARIQSQTDPLILDVATGAGRLPLIMARNGRFRGHVIGLDASRRMLDVARRKVAAERFESYITLMRHDAGERLPFADDAFDVVTCLEALEFLPDPQAALKEMCRVLRPGGMLLTSIRIDTRWMPNRTWSEEKMQRELRALEMRDIHIAIWQEDYSQVWARKAGESVPIGAGAREQVLHYTSPGQPLQNDDAWNDERSS